MGHNLLGVGAAAAAVAVKDYIKESGLPGTIAFYGCPAEENGSAKVYLSREGVFDSWMEYLPGIRAATTPLWGNILWQR